MGKRSIIITAGGIGKRMGAAIPKQFLLLKNKPILMHTMQRFYDFDPLIQIILVLPKEELAHWESLCRKYEFGLNHEVTVGGKERFHSVKEGLKMASGDVIGVHDAVRPLVSSAVIQNCFETAEKHGAAIPIIDLKESIRKVMNNESIAVDRSNFKLVQTPQCFEAQLLKSAYEKSYSPLFTDDASVVEAYGKSIQLVVGNEENIKLTTPADLKIAAFFLSNE